MGGASAYNFMVAAAVTVGSFTYGFNNSVIAPVYGIPAFLNYFGLSADTDDQRTASIIGAANGLFFGGGMLGCFTVAWKGDFYGRVRNLQIAAATCLIAAIIQGASVHIAMFIVGRFISGYGSGAIVSLIPTYLSEIAPPHMRGRMVGLAAVGQVTGYAGPATDAISEMPVHPGVCWFAFKVRLRALSTRERHVLKAHSIVISPAFILAVSPWLPESPRWLMLRGLHAEAFASLKKLHHTAHDTDDILAREEYLQIKKQVNLDILKPRTLWAILKIPSYRRRLFTAMFLEFLYQSTGVLVVNNYQVLLYSNLGLNGSVTLLLYAVYCSWAGVVNFASTYFIDRFGRVKMMIWGTIGSIANIILLMSMIAKYGGTTNKIANGFGVFFLFFYVTWYGFGIDPTIYVYMSELFPTHVRSQGVAMGLASFLGSALVYNEVAGTAFATIGWKYYLVFIAVTLAGLPFLLFCCPETKGLTLEEVGQLFGDEVGLDLTHMTPEQRQELDRKLLAEDPILNAGRSSPPETDVETKSAIPGRTVHLEVADV
ncbi:MFS sugar transporter [Fonsecaea pedrosoi]|nr:MFS sugar transporter [Fonsecaea pedrosoi]